MKIKLLKLLIVPLIGLGIATSAMAEGWFDWNDTGYYEENASYDYDNYGFDETDYTEDYYDYDDNNGWFNNNYDWSTDEGWFDNDWF